jgi:hypothetical protein
LLHRTYEEAFAEVVRVNRALDELEVKANKGFIKKPWYVQKSDETCADFVDFKIAELLKEFMVNE